MHATIIFIIIRNSNDTKQEILNFVWRNLISLFSSFLMLLVLTLLLVKTKSERLIDEGGNC